MHFTDTVYRNPYWPTFPLLQITQGCTHNNCKFCTIILKLPTSKAIVTSHNLYYEKIDTFRVWEV